MPISQDRVLAVLRAAERCLSIVEAIKNVTIYELRTDPNNLTARQLQEILLFNHTLLEDTTMIKIELSHFTPNRIRQNERAADRQRRYRQRRNLGGASDDIAINEISREISGKLGPETKAYLESKGVKVKTPDYYDKLATEHNATLTPAATPPHPQAHKFHDNLADVPQHEGDLFAEPNDGET